jgi:hypothetical protein
MQTRRILPQLRWYVRVLWVSLVLSLGIWAASGAQTAYARYADGAGTGKYQNQIYWLEWDGFTVAGCRKDRALLRLSAPVYAATRLAWRLVVGVSGCGQGASKTRAT